MIRILFIPFFILIGLQTGIAQSVTGKVIDFKTGESIPYANIKVNESENLVSNADGYFTIPESKSGDDSVLIISYLGYVNRQIKVSELKNQQYIVRLEEGIVELDAVNVSKPDPYSIMATVKKNLKQNYQSDGQPSKNMLFYRETSVFKPSKLDLEITKSTGFTKKGLAAANAQINAFTSKMISHPPQEFTDMLCNYYTATMKKDDKPVQNIKLGVIKATKLKDENRSASFDDLEEKGLDIFLQHLDSTKYYRVKSGLFGSRDTITMRKDYNKKKNKTKKTQLDSSKSNLSWFMQQNSFLQNAKLDFVSQPELYDYTYEGSIYSNQNEFIYVLTFKPRKSKAKYTGKLYVSETDYAVVRADYNLAEGKIVEGINLKFFLGVKASENVSKGTMIFKPKPTGTGYYLQYASRESGQYIYINRPLKFIELTKEEKDVVALDLKIEGNSRDKTEYLDISRTAITEDDFENVKEEDFSYLILKQYDPNIWKNYSAIEPLEEMKQFSVAN